MYGRLYQQIPSFQNPFVPLRVKLANHILADTFEFRSTQVLVRTTLGLEFYLKFVKLDRAVIHPSIKVYKQSTACVSGGKEVHVNVIYSRS